MLNVAIAYIGILHGVDIGDIYIYIGIIGTLYYIMYLYIYIYYMRNENINQRRGVDVAEKMLI